LRARTILRGECPAGVESPSHGRAPEERRCQSACCQSARGITAGFPRYSAIGFACRRVALRASARQLRAAFRRNMNERLARRGCDVCRELRHVGKSFSKPCLYSDGCFLVRASPTRSRLHVTCYRPATNPMFARSSHPPLWYTRCRLKYSRGRQKVFIRDSASCVESRSARQAMTRRGAAKCPAAARRR